MPEFFCLLPRPTVPSPREAGTSQLPDTSSALSPALSFRLNTLTLCGLRMCSAVPQPRGHTFPRTCVRTHVHEHALGLTHTETHVGAAWPHSSAPGTSLSESRGGAEVGGSGAALPRFQPWRHHLPAVGPWAYYLVSSASASSSEKGE